MMNDEQEDQEIERRLHSSSGAHPPRESRSLP
jgi:hypothetical protein